MLITKDAIKALFLLVGLVLLEIGTITCMAEEPPMPQAANYETALVARGSYIETQSDRAYEYYADKAVLRYQGGGSARLVEYTVKEGDAVKKDDIVGILAVDSSAADFEGAKIAHVRAQEDFAAGKNGWEKKIAGAQKLLAAMTEEYDRQIQQLKIDKLQLEYRLYCHQQERGVKLFQQALDEQAQKRARVELRAPFSGVIENIGPKREGDVVINNEGLITMYNPEGMFLTVDNESGGFRYNAPVTVEIGVGDKSAVLSGRVVASDNILPHELHTKSALIQLDSKPDDIVLKNISVTVETKRIDGANLVPRNAVGRENGKFFVNKLTGGAIQKRYIILGSDNSQETWVVVGLEDGETVLID